MVSPTNADAKGILNPHIAEKKFHLTRHLPSSDLASFVEWYWIIHWDLRGQAPYTQDVLPYPAVNFAIVAARAGRDCPASIASSHPGDRRQRVLKKWYAA